MNTQNCDKKQSQYYGLLQKQLVEAINYIMNYDLLNLAKESTESRVYKQTLAKNRHVL